MAMERVRRFAAALGRLGALVRAVIGVPDYERYVEHMRGHHSGEPFMTRGDFARERMEARYSRPGAKCC